MAMIAAAIIGGSISLLGGAFGAISSNQRALKKVEKVL